MIRLFKAECGGDENSRQLLEIGSCGYTDSSVDLRKMRGKFMHI